MKPFSTRTSMFYSIGMHLLLFMGFLLFKGRSSEAEVVVLDFSIEKTAVTEPIEATPSHSLSLQKRAIKPLPANVDESFPDTTVLDTAAPLPAEVAPVQTESAGEDSIQKLKALYLATHYHAIRNQVHQALYYPETAQNSGWEGEVYMAFFVHCDGRVDSIKILRSSGYAILDESAIQAVKKAAPYKPSPKKVEIRLPITFRLE